MINKKYSLSLSWPKYISYIYVYIWFLPQGFWLTTPKGFGICWIRAIKLSSVMLISDFGKHLGNLSVGGHWLLRDPKNVRRVSELSVPPPHLLGGQRYWVLVALSSTANAQWLWNEACIKTQKDKIGRTFWLVNLWKFGESGVCLEKVWKPSTLFPYLALYLFYLAVPELYYFIVNE